MPGLLFPAMVSRTRSVGFLATTNRRFLVYMKTYGVGYDPYQALFRQL
jgi:hypothetical protein